MELIAILFFLGIYLLVSSGVIKAAMAWAKWQERRRWLWGGLAGFLMYNLIFWDWVPTMVAYKYYCNTQAGFTVFKTPEQWLAEHPTLNKVDLKPLGKGEMLSTFPYRPLFSNPKQEGMMLNQYIYIGHQEDYFLRSLPVHREISFVADYRTDERMAELVTFYTSYRDRNSWKAMKYWMHFGLCGYSNRGDQERSTGYIAFIKDIMSFGEKHD